MWFFWEYKYSSPSEIRVLIMPETIQREEMPEYDTVEAGTENVHQRPEENQDYVEGGRSSRAYILEILQPWFCWKLGVLWKTSKKAVIS